MSPERSLQSQLLHHLEAVARPRHLHWNRLGLLAVRSYLNEQLGALGPVEENTFDEGQGEGVNLILRLPGRKPELPPLLVGAHYDGPLESIGADDNASGPRYQRSCPLGLTDQPGAPTMTDETAL